MITSHASLDWGLVEGDPLVAQGLGRAGQPESRSATSVWWGRIASAAWNGIVALGVIQVALVLVNARVAWSQPAAPMPSWLFLVNVLLFGGSGGLLLFGGRRDRRLWSLGAVFVMIAAAFAHPLAGRVGDDGWSAWGISGLCVDAFFGAALWRFVWAFPRRPEQRVARLAGRFFVSFSCSAGLALLVANILDAPAFLPAAEGLFRALDRDSAGSAYWLISFAPALFAMPYLAWKTRLEEEPSDRRRVKFVFLALTVGIAPFLVAVVTSVFVPALGRAPLRDVIGIALYAALASIIPSMAYAVVVERVMEIEWTVARAKQWQMARYAASCFGLLPLTLVFALANAPYMAKHMIEDKIES